MPLAAGNTSGQSVLRKSSIATWPWDGDRPARFSLSCIRRQQPPRYSWISHWRSGQRRRQEQALGDWLGRTRGLVLLARSLQQAIKGSHVSNMDSSQVLAERVHLVPIGPNQFHHIMLIANPTGGEFEFHQMSQVNKAQGGAGGAKV